MVVTISREYGAAARAVSEGVAERLRYRLLDDDLPVVIASHLGTSPEVIETVEHRRPGLAERMLRSLNAAVPELSQPVLHADDIDEDAVREIERHVRAAAAAGDVVIVGRVANAILGAGPDLVRVFLRAPLPWRIDHVAASLGVGTAEARAEIDRIDGGRHAYAEERYGIVLGDPRHYDLVVDVARFGVEGAAELVAAAVSRVGA
jgi:cytidylate kinase